jgi:hypothetical protein
VNQDDQTYAQALKRLDRSARRPPRSRAARATALLEQVLATPVEPPGPVRRTASPGRRRAGLLAMALPAAAVLGVAVWAGTNRGSDAVYASWTPTASAVGQADLALATSACRTELASFGDVDDNAWLDPRRTPEFISERRGDIVLVFPPAGRRHRQRHRGVPRPTAGGLDRAGADRRGRRRRERPVARGRAAGD